MRDDGVADVELDDLAHGRHRSYVAVIESVARVNLEPDSCSETGGTAQSLELGSSGGAGSLGVCAGMQLDDRGAARVRALDLPVIRIDEERRPHSCRAQSRDRIANAIKLHDD